MQRRRFIKSSILASTAIGLGASRLNALTINKHTELSGLKIKKIKYYSAPGYTKPLFNQARGIVEIETDSGITGIGEGGFKDVIQQCAQMIIGQDPFRIEHIWQLMYRGMFYPQDEKNYSP